MAFWRSSLLTLPELRNTHDRDLRTRTGTRTPQRRWKLAGDGAPESRKHALRLGPGRGPRRPRDPSGKYREDPPPRRGAGAAPLQKLTHFPPPPAEPPTHDTCARPPDHRMLT